MVKKLPMLRAQRSSSCISATCAGDVPVMCARMRWSSSSSHAGGFDTFETIALCSGYEIDGELHDEFPADLSALERATPRYEWMPGWQKSTADARKIEDLPSAARKYLDRMQALVEAPITYVSVGTRRDQIIGL